MADWFKFYENDLDEKRLQYAISKLPEVVSVWVGILSECCRHKSDTIRWGSNEIELFGFSRCLGISIPKVNEGIRLLVEIDYVVQIEGMIKVVKWAEKQSEYCQKKAKKKADTKPKKQQVVQTVSGHCPDSVVLEERRGEESREDGEYVAPSAVEICSEDEAVALVAVAGIPETFTRYVHQDWSSRAGKDAAGNVVQFQRYATKRWAREQVEWRNGNHRGCKQASRPQVGPTLKELQEFAFDKCGNTPEVQGFIGSYHQFWRNKEWKSKGVALDWKSDLQIRLAEKRLSK